MEECGGTGFRNDARSKQTIDNSAHPCYIDTIVTCIFVSGEYNAVYSSVKFAESTSHPNLNVMCCCIRITAVACRIGPKYHRGIRRRQSAREGRYEQSGIRILSRSRNQQIPENIGQLVC